MGRIVAINRSEKKGTVKTEIAEGRFIADYGLEGDAHAGKWHRQVSLLDYGSFLAFGREAKIPMNEGIFGENLLVEGLDLSSVKVGDQLRSHDVLLEITQIGKECHKACEIRSIVGNCIMPTEGIFARVLEGGILRKGDEICFVPSSSQ